MIGNNLFFNNILKLAIEGFIEFVIFGILNAKTADFRMNGEIMGFIFGTFSLSLSAIVLPILTIGFLIIYN